MAIDLTQTGITALSLTTAQEIFAYLRKKIHGDTLEKRIHYLEQCNAVLIRGAKKARWNLSIQVSDE